METCEYSTRLGRISPAQFQVALGRFNLGQLVSATPIPFGLFGQNVFVRSTTGEYVLRGCPHYAWQLPTEQFFAHLLHERADVPVPWPYLIDPSEEIFGWRWGYALMPRMPGLQLADPAVHDALDADDKRGIAHALGENLRRMQCLTWTVAGEYAPESGAVRPFDTAYGSWIAARIHRNLALARGYSARTTASDAAWVESLIVAAEPTFDEPYQPRYVMEDYKEANVVVQKVGGTWRVSGIFDLMSSHFGDGEADLSRQVAAYLDEDPARAETFIHAYTQRWPLRPGYAERLQLYMLDDRLSIWEYFQRPAHAASWREAGTLRDWAERYTSYAAFSGARAYQQRKGDS
jgi:hygromycin-B 7''-O-kinase